MCSKLSYSNLENEWNSSLKMGDFDPFPELSNPNSRGNTSMRKSMAYPPFPNKLDSLYSQYNGINEYYCNNRADNMNSYLPLDKTQNGFGKNSYETYCMCRENKFNRYEKLDNTYTRQPYFETYQGCCEENRFNRYNSLEKTSGGMSRNVYESYPVEVDKPNDICKKGNYQTLNTNWHSQKLYEL
jgi:hypothetical protein